MSNLTKLEFVALDISGNNYLARILDAEIHLDAMNLGNTIKDGNESSAQDRAKAMIFLRHHLHEGLKAEYLTVKDPQVLWSNLKDRYDHQKTVILPKARYEWMHLRLQDYKSVSEYNSAVFKITSQLKLCGEHVTDEDMLEKTFSTFHASNLVLQQQYRERGFKKYSELVSCLLVAEQNNELLMKNHQARPVGSSPIPEANAMTLNDRWRGQRSRRGRGPNRGRGHGRGRGSYNKNYSVQKRTRENNGKKHEGHRINEKVPKKNEDACHRCGMKGHWRRTCRMPKHFVDLYQASIKEIGNSIETNFVGDLETKFVEHGKNDFTHLDVADFFVDNENVNEV